MQLQRGGSSRPASLSVHVGSVLCSAVAFKVANVLSKPGCVRSRLSSWKPRAVAADVLELLMNFLQPRMVLPLTAVNTRRIR